MTVRQVAGNGLHEMKMPFTLNAFKEVEQGQNHIVYKIAGHLQYKMREGETSNFASSRHFVILKCETDRDFKLFLLRDRSKS